MKTANALLLGYAQTRDRRDRVRDARDECFCERHEGIEIVDGIPTERLGSPCWKAARHWSHDEEGQPSGFYLDPPIGQWCATCRARQAYTEQLRAAVREHAAAKRSILQRGRALGKHSQAGENR